MKIATFNVNGIASRLSALLEWLAKDAPDVVCLQELKASDEAFPAQAIRDAGYGVIWHGQRSWNGVAILAKGVVPTDFDIYDPKHWKKDALLQPAAREAYQRLLNAGLRIDHLLLNKELAPRLVDAKGLPQKKRAGRSPLFPRQIPVVRYYMSIPPMPPMPPPPPPCA